MNWQQLISILFGILAIVYGWVQIKERNNSIFVFVIWTLVMATATGCLIHRFKDKKKKERKRIAGSEI